MTVDTSSAESVLLVLTVGGLMGMFGQGIRAVAGLKSMVDRANAANADVQDEFRAARLIVSLIIGFLAGIAATLATGPANILPHIGELQTLLMLAAAGYAGTDIIESFLSNYLPGGKPKPAGTNTGNPGDDPKKAGGGSGGASNGGGAAPASAQTLTDMSKTLSTLRSNVSVVMASMAIDKTAVARQAVHDVLDDDGFLYPGVDDMTFSGDTLGYTVRPFLSFLQRVAERIGDANHTFTPNMAFAADYVDSTVSKVIDAIADNIDVLTQI